MALTEMVDVDAERRFGGLSRLYGERDYRRLRGARFAVVGLGGVGSWAVEALARSGVASLTLIDFDQVAESNINRQVQALSSTVGQSKGEALRARIHEIHPACEVRFIEEFVAEDNWPALLTHEIDGLVDACDQIRAKAVLAAWARERKLPFVSVGAAGGKRAPQAIEVQDLADTTHDPLLSSLRQRLRKFHAAPRAGRIGVRCVFSREAVKRPQAEGEACDVDGTLNCAGYGSSVMVTSSFGMAAAAVLVQDFLARNLSER